MKRLYFIGIDSVPLWIVKELSKEKGMEIFEKMLKNNLLVEMESTLPPMTGPAWPSIYTGLPPSEHGVPDFFAMKSDYTPDIVYYDPKVTPPFWEALAQKGKRCLVITPATVITLPEHKNVEVITGFPLPSRANSRELERLMKKYKFFGEPDIEKDMKSGKMSEETAVKYYVESIRARSGIVKEMLEKNSYDLIYVCFTETDRIQHFTLNKRNWKEYLLPVYREIAAFVGYIAALAEKENAAMIVVSDHGAQPIKEKFLLNSWLINNGFAKLKDSFGIPEGRGDNASYGVREKILKSGLRKGYDKLPYPVKKLAFKTFATVFPGGAVGKYVRTHLFDMDMDKTRAFAAVSNDPVATLWINDSRFSKGIISNGKKAKLKHSLMKKLAGIKSKEGDRLLVDIIDGSKYYGRTKKFLAADVLIEAKRGYTLDIFYYSKTESFMKPENAKSGDHIRKGIFCLYSKSIRAYTDNITVLDVAPIVLKYFGERSNTKRLIGI